MRVPILALSLAFAGPVLAGPLPDGGVTLQEVASALRASSLPVEVNKDANGDPMIDSSFKGTKFGVYFYDCKKQTRCGSIQFAAGYSGAAATPARIADWNRGKRFGRAYLDGGSAWVEMDADMERGATTEALANNLERWLEVMPQFATHIGAR